MADRVPKYRPTLTEVLAGMPLSAAERRLLDAAKAGERADYGDTLPEAATDDNRLRAALIRLLLLGGDEGKPLHPNGVRAWGAFITGPLDFENCETHLDLSLWNCRFDTAPNLRDAHLGALFLPGCAVPGIDLHRLRTEGDVHLRGGFTSQGTVNLGSARIGGGLDCKNASLSGTETTVDGVTSVGPALNGNAMTVGAAVFLANGFAARGQVNLVRAAITGRLACVDGRFDGVTQRAPDGAETVGPSLNGNAMTVGASVFLRGGFTARGQVNLGGASITGQLTCGGGQFDGVTQRAADGAETVGPALIGSAMTVGDSLFLSGGFTARGQVSLVRAAITGQLACVDGTFDGVTQRTEDGTTLEQKIALQAQEMTVGSSFIWTGIQGEALKVVLTEAEVGPLVDDAASWGRVTSLDLEGFRYRSINSGMTIAERLEWVGKASQRKLNGKGLLARMQVDDFDPHPYTQLAQVLRARGERRGAARVLFVRERRMARAELHRALREPRPPLQRLWAIIVACFFRVIAFFFRSMFGYGHFPARALVWAVCIWGATATFARLTYDAGQMAPAPSIILTSDEWLAAVREGCPLPSAPDFAERQAAGCVAPLVLWTGEADSAKDYETFSAGLYALDLFLPLDALGQETAWAPSKDRGTLGWWGFYLRWVVKALGWILAVVGAAVLTGLVGKRDD